VVELDIALQVVIDPANHDLSYDAEKDARRLVRGDVIAVYPATDLATLDGSSNYIPNQPIGNARLGFVFVTGVPDVAWGKIQNFLQEHSVLEVKQQVVNDWQWQVMQIHGYYEPFVSTPTVQSSTVEAITNMRVKDEDLPAARNAFFSGLTELAEGNGITLMSGNIYMRTLSGNMSVTKMRRKYGIDVPSIPAGVRAQINADRYITFTWTQVKNYLRHKADARLVVDTDLN